MADRPWCNRCGDGSRYGADVGETGSGEPGARTALRARSNDVDLIHELPYGPAACEPPQQRPDTWQHPIPRRSCPKILLAPEGASTHALREVLAQQPVGVLVRATLPGAVRIAEVDRHASLDPELGVLGHFRSLIPRQRSSQLFG